VKPQAAIPRILAAMLARPAPASKADCLNWAFRRLQEPGQRTGRRYEIVATHDAEDVVRPESLRLISWFAADYEVVQIPALALPTPAREFTHGPPASRYWVGSGTAGARHAQRYSFWRDRKGIVANLLSPVANGGQRSLYLRADRTGKQ
jgi:hypothetical protein